MLVPDYNTYMDEQQRINLRLAEEMASMGVDFAYPTRTVFLSQPEAERDAPERAAPPAGGQLAS